MTNHPGRRRWLLTAERAALAVAGLALIGTLSAPIVAESVKTDPPPLPESCLELQTEYATAIEQSLVSRERILPGIDGKSTMLTDPQAQYCGLQPSSFEPPRAP
jgi:hypothetical protein